MFDNDGGESAARVHQWGAPLTGCGPAGTPHQKNEEVFSGPLALLVAGLDGLAAQAPAELPGGQALMETRQLLVQQDRLRAVALARVADVETRQLHDLDDAPSTPTWVARQQTSMTRSQVTLARRLERVPQVAARIAAGGLSVDGGVRVERALAVLRPHVDRSDGAIDGQPGEEVLPAVIVDGVGLVLAEAAGGLDEDDPRLRSLRAELTDIVERPVSQLVRLEAAFLVVASQVEPGQLRAALTVLTDALLPAQLADRANDAHLRRRLELVRDEDGSGWTVRGHLDLECGELLHTALTAAMSTDRDNPRDTAEAAALREQDVDPYLDRCSQVRNLAQRRHDAFTLLVRRLLDSGVLGQRGKQVPHLAVTVPAAALQDLPGALPARGSSGATLPAGLVRRWWCDSAATRFVMSAGHRVLEISHTERTLKPHERRIKHVETGGICQVAGCYRGTSSGHRLIPHHVDAFARSGSTCLGETVLLCEVSHRDMHEGNKTLLLKNGRRVNHDGWADVDPDHVGPDH
ncbi:MAG: hypothetical protein NVS3B26_27810 [Mycobacteriales bacterium]